MKLFITILAFATLIAGCNNDKTDNHENHKTSVENKTTEVEKDNIQTLKPSFTVWDENVSAHIRSIFDHYAHIKTALVNENTLEAKRGADAILQSVKTFDKSLLPADQKKAYDKSIVDLRNSASQISSSGDPEAQRVHFSTLSIQAYGLAKSFGAGKTIYHDHCPMAFDNKGAMWLSENKEISNPYFGKKMMNCGTVEEIIEN